MRTCRTCSVEKQEAEFYWNKRDGFLVHCKTCINLRERAAYHGDIVNSREKAKRYTALNRARYPEKFTKEARRASRLRHYAKHRSAVIAKSRQWRKDNPGATWKQVQAWRDKSAVNTERFRQINVAKENRRRDRSGASRLKPGEIREMLDAQGWVCAYCPTSLREVAYELEHRTPICRGGKTVRENLCMACASCNRRKHTMTAEEFQAA